MNGLPLCEEIHRAHLLRRPPIMRVFCHTDDFKIPRMLHIVAEVLADGVAVFEIFFSKKRFTTATLRVVGVSCSLMARPSTIFVPMVSK